MRGIYNVKAMRALLKVIRYRSFIKEIFACYFSNAMIPKKLLPICICIVLESLIK